MFCCEMLEGVCCEMLEGVCCEMLEGVLLRDARRCFVARC